jgi:large subunit ribosomal protein L18
MAQKILTRKEKKNHRLKRHLRIRNKIIGTKGVPRLSVFRSLKNTYVQLIDDIEGKTLLSFSTAGKDIKAKLKYGGNVKAASLLGEEFAKQASAKGIKKIVFDRGGYLYHGRLKALAEGLRKGGLQF